MKYTSLRAMALTDVPSTVPTSVVLRYMRNIKMYPDCNVQLGYNESLGWYIFDANENSLIWSQALS